MKSDHHDKISTLFYKSTIGEANLVRKCYNLEALAQTTSAANADIG